MAKQHFQRFNLNFEEAEFGRQFIESPGHIDLENLKILYSSVDTVRQLYKLRLKEQIIEDLGIALEGIPGGKVVYSFAGYDWMLRRGGASGYQYMLQNAEIGLVILLKSRYAKLEASGTHLKIEVSPKMIFDNTPQDLQLVLNNFADMFAVDSLYSPAGVAIHLACDYQGWEPPKHFVEIRSPADQDAYLTVPASVNSSSTPISAPFTDKASPTCSALPLPCSSPCTTRAKKLTFQTN